MKTIAIPNPRRMPFSSSQRTAGPERARDEKSGDEDEQDGPEPDQQPRRADEKDERRHGLGETARSARFSVHRTLSSLPGSPSAIFLPAHVPVTCPSSPAIVRRERRDRHALPTAPEKRAGWRGPITSRRRSSVPCSACSSFRKSWPAPCYCRRHENNRISSRFPPHSSCWRPACPSRAPRPHSLIPRCRPECTRPRCPGTCTSASSSRLRRRASTRSWSRVRAARRLGQGLLASHRRAVELERGPLVRAAPARPLGQRQLQEGARRHALHPRTLVERAPRLQLIPNRRSERSWTQSSSSSSSCFCSAAAASTGTRDAGNVAMRHPTALLGALLALGDSRHSPRGPELPPLVEPANAEHHVGKVIWADLATPDLAGAKRFYSGCSAGPSATFISARRTTPSRSSTAGRWEVCSTGPCRPVSTGRPG